MARRISAPYEWAQKTTDRATQFPPPTKVGRVYRDSLKGCYIGGGNQLEWPLYQHALRIDAEVASAPDAVTGTYYPAPDGFWQLLRNN